MITAIIAGISALVSAVSSGWIRYQERKQAQQEVELAIARAKIQQITTQLELRNKLSIAQLKATPAWFKVITFVGWFTPFIVTVISPETGAMIFNNLSYAPQWYVSSCITLLMVSWGVSVGKESIAAIFTGVVDDMKYRRKLKESEKTRKIERKAFFDVVRQHLRTIDSSEVAAIDKALDSLEGKE